MKWKYRIVFALLGLISLLAAGNLIATSVALEELQEERLRTSEVMFARTIAGGLYRDVIERNTADLTNRLFDEKKIQGEKLAYLLVFDEGGEVLAHTFFHPIPDALLQVSRRFDDVEGFHVERIELEELDAYDVAVPVDEGIRQVGSLHLGVSGDHLRNTIRVARRSSVAIAGPVLLVAIALAILLARAITRPLRSLGDAAARLGGGALETRVAVGGHDEFAQLAETFNRMAESLQKAKDDLKIAKEAAESSSATKSAFLASMSHELRTPLNAIIGYGEMLEEESEELGMASFVQDVKKILSAARHLLSLINNVLDLSKVEAGRFELCLDTFDGAEAVHGIVSMVKQLVEKNGNVLEVDVAPDLGMLHADSTRLRQVLFNLLSNAAKFTEKGTISFVARRERGDGGDWAVFSVTDTGIGITPAQESKLFKAFSQANTQIMRRYGGTGLGLAISRKFCQLMGGEITVTSVAGVGSTFMARIPANVRGTSEGREAGNGERSRGPASPGEALLVIDDDPAVREILSRYLGAEGFRVVCAGSGEEGLSQARAIRPLAITLDLLMPGTDGWAVLRELKSDPDLADIPVIIVSILDQSDRGFTLGASDYVIKPVDRGRILELARRYCAKGATAPVLVVDDHPEMRALIGSTLRGAGWRVREATNGRTALAQCAEERPGLILLDLTMPEMDGFQFLEEFRKTPLWPHVPVVVVTARDLTAEDKSRLDGYVERILSKGAYDKGELLQLVRSLLRRFLNRDRPETSPRV